MSTQKFHVFNFFFFSSKDKNRQQVQRNDEVKKQTEKKNTREAFCLNKNKTNKQEGKKKVD